MNNYTEIRQSKRIGRLLECTGGNVARVRSCCNESAVNAASRLVSCSNSESSLDCANMSSDSNPSFTLAFSLPKPSDSTSWPPRCSATNELFILGKYISPLKRGLSVLQYVSVLCPAVLRLTSRRQLRRTTQRSLRRNISSV